jgi:KaiC/GvpD/RAD55 family RecA-like ATPase
MYINLRQGLRSKPNLIPVESGYDNYIDDDNKDWYVSLYKYNEEHKAILEKTGTLSGIKDVATDTLYFDFDDEKNIDNAKSEATDLAVRLIEDGFDEEDIQAYFSGMKGFGIEIKLSEDIPVERFKSILEHYKAKGVYKTLDLVVSDPQRIIRVPNTKHNKSGLYKVPLDLWEMDELSVDEIKTMAVEPREYEWTNNTSSLPPILKNVYIEVPKIKVANEFDKIDFTGKPRHWKPYKWALLQGYFQSGERHQALMVIAATCRSLGYSKDVAYDMCKGALRRSIDRYGQGGTDKKELFTNIIEESIFSDRWNGGAYSPKTNPWLMEYCKRMDIKVEEEEDKPCVEVSDMGLSFEKYAKEFDKNLIKVGLPTFDKHATFLTSTHNGILGAPGSGKSQFSLNFLKYASKENVNSIFLSLDMGSPLVYGTLIRGVLGCPFREAMDIYRNNKKKAAEIDAKIKEQYKNVGFNFRAGLTVPDIKEIVKEQENRTGQKVKILVTDYLECLASPYADATASHGYITNQLKDLANELELCSLLLLQTQKHSTGDISDPLLSMRQIKGSSIIEQSCSTIVTLWREGYSPKTVERDRFISFAIVKNRFGSLWTGDFSWDGPKGHIFEISEEEREQLSLLRNDKAAAKKEKDDEWK